jgi:hypothetical protein
MPPGACRLLRCRNEEALEESYGRGRHRRRTQPDVARRRLFRVAGIAGLAAVVLIFVAVLVGTRQEPTFNAAATEVLSYYQSPNTPGADFRCFMLTVGLITFVWFVVALTTLLRRAEGEPPWRVHNRDGLRCAPRGTGTVRERGCCRLPRR